MRTIILVTLLSAATPSFVGAADALAAAPAHTASTGFEATMGAIGHIAETVAAQAARATWLPWLGYVILALTAVAAGLAARKVNLILGEAQRERSKLVLPLAVCNVGNERSRYDLWAEGPPDVLRFEWRLEGVALAPRQLAGDARTARSWARTPDVLPGRMLNLELVVDPVQPFEPQEHAFRVISKSVEQEAAQAENSTGASAAPWVTAERVIKVPGLPWQRRYGVPAIVYAAAVAMVALMAALLAVLGVF